MSDYHNHPFWTERFESDAELRESNALVFTGEDMQDEDDFEAAELAMDRDMAERERCWRDEATAWREHALKLQDELTGSRRETDDA